MAPLGEGMGMRLIRSGKMENLIFCIFGLRPLTENLSGFWQSCGGDMVWQNYAGNSYVSL